jgi:hypothetical protein
MEGLQFKDGNYLAMSYEGVLVYGTTVTSNATTTFETRMCGTGYEGATAVRPKRLPEDCYQKQT